MTKLSRAERAKYPQVIGSRRQVFNGSAHHTSGGLKKSDLMMSKNGRIVSKSKHFSAKKDKRLVKAGYGTKKGKFGFVLLGTKGKGKGKKTAKRGKKMKGGFSGHLSLSPSNFEGDVAAVESTEAEVAGSMEGGPKESSVAVQEEAGQAGGRRRRRTRRGGHSNIDVGLSPSVFGQDGGKRRRRRSRKTRKHGGNIIPPS